MRVLLASALTIFILSVVASGQTKQPPLCRYKPYTDLPLRENPSPNAARVGTVPGDKWVQALAKQSYWIKLNIKGVEGWATTAGMGRDEKCPRVPFLEAHSNGYKIIKGIHRNFFGLYNAGTGSYTGKVTVRVFSGDRMLNEVEADFANDPIVDSGGRSFYVDTYSRADRFEVDTSDGMLSGVIDRFIERID